MSDLAATQTEFNEAISQVFMVENPKRIIETGTYKGEGSTSTIAALIRGIPIRDARFYSIECNPELIKEATKNLNEDNLLEYVRIWNGLSIPRSLLPDESQIFDMIEEAPHDIYIDNRDNDPVGHYLKETKDCVNSDGIGRCLAYMDNKVDFVLLDSAGHLGFIEFKYLINMLKSRCIIALDDVFHLKHYKSVSLAMADERFTILKSGREKFGYAIMEFNP